MKKRMHQIELFMKYPHEVQDELLIKLLHTAKKTEFGLNYDFKNIKNVEQYRAAVPVRTYESLYPYIERRMKGEQNLLWPTDVKWFAKSSGTTNARSKFIPVSNEALEECHFKGGKDLISIYVNNYPDSKMFSGKGLAIGGSHQVNEMDPKANSYYGDVSAVIMKNLPLWAQLIRTPSLDVALMDNWEEKIEKMAQSTLNENVTSISGVPTWTILLLQRLMEMKGVKDMTEIWPNLEVFFHGAVSFTPYRQLFKQLIPSTGMRYVETYNASEGFFGIQDQKDSDELLLMLDYGIYYEFIPHKEIQEENPRALGLNEVKTGEIYAMLITTNSGLWRYSIGDTIKFTSLNPYRIKIAGRTKHFINAFGEELVVENAETAITKACKETDALIDNFTAAPIHFTDKSEGGHEWVIEFKKEPNDLSKFTQILDETLRLVNSDYDAKRYKDMALKMPIVHMATCGTFYQWMKNRGKLGGQNKVPRLANTREYIDDILDIMKK
ncbi:GH3 auxin-responsive promoter family protein [Reichenbachiella agarivorans]|uniref:GH3 auxin-responsive promoter family protein n=1 Tax=Reichenbachiella agarivorans TaxID=2979464 RepID=A0ABY6CUG2_9BACT|nr:GH3 auxin-responsive promoter family protein [Reichenbachiella agarivorans]UXP34167.1 GH3 auxin-responsive promoter family protein [Reichenbachiella agarivorans]